MDFATEHVYSWTHGDLEWAEAACVVMLGFVINMTHGELQYEQLVEQTPY